MSLWSRIDRERAHLWLRIREHCYVSALHKQQTDRVSAVLSFCAFARRGIWL
jgi:hypothetical protein